MPKIKANDINLYYEIYGKGDPIVFVAGFAADHTAWQNIAKTYATNYQVIVFDNRGAGQSDCPNYPYTVEMMADDTIALCKALEINSAHFIGNSMGGSIVQTIAYKSPEIVKSVILSNSFPKTNARLSLQVQGNLALRKTNIAPETLVKLILSTIYSAHFLEQDGIVDRLTKLILNNPHPVSLQGYANQTNALLTFNSTSWLSEIKRPCLVIAADDDFLADVESAKKMASSIPNAEFFCFNQVGHFPHIEQTDLFNQLALKFIEKHST